MDSNFISQLLPILICFGCAGLLVFLIAAILMLLSHRSKQSSQVTPSQPPASTQLIGLNENKDTLLSTHNRTTALIELVMEHDYEGIASLIADNKNIALELVYLLQVSDVEICSYAAEAIAEMGINDDKVPDAIKTILPQLLMLAKSSVSQVRIAVTRALEGIADNGVLML